LQKYGDLTVCEIAAVRHIGFLKIHFFTVGTVNSAFCITKPNIVKIGQTVAEKSRFLVIFTMAPAAILDIQKFEILTVDPLYRANLRHHAKFHLTRSHRCRIWPFNRLYKMAAVRNLGFVGRDWDHPQWSLSGFYRCAKFG